MLSFLWFWDLTQAPGYMVSWSNIFKKRKGKKGGDWTNFFAILKHFLPLLFTNKNAGEGQFARVGQKDVWLCGQGPLVLVIGFFLCFILLREGMLEKQFGNQPLRGN